MYIKFFDPSGDPFRSFAFNHITDIEFKSYGIKVIDKYGICHMVQFKEFSKFYVVM